jgi:hypothetical protein
MVANRKLAPVLLISSVLPVFRELNMTGCALACVHELDHVEAPKGFLGRCDNGLELLGENHADGPDLDFGNAHVLARCV